MCGRYALFGPFQLNAAPAVEHWVERIINPLIGFAHYNITPTLSLPIIRLQDAQPVVSSLRWGLIPAWAKDRKLSYATINARAETVREKPAYRGAWRAARRCLVPMTGWYEWQEIGKHKQPYYFSAADGQNPLFAAGLWESRIEAGGEDMSSFTLLTTEAVGVVAEVHDRQPVILSLAHGQKWLTDSIQQAESFLQPAPLMVRYHAVGVDVSRVKNNTPDLLTPQSPRTL